MQITNKHDFEKITLKTKILDKASGVFHKIQIIHGSKPQSSTNAPLLMRSGTTNLETYSLHFKNKPIGEIKVSRKVDIIDWLSNTNQSQYGLVGTALLEFASKLQKLRDKQHATAHTYLEATTGSSLYYYNFGFRFLENRKNKILADQMKSTKGKKLKSLDDIPTGDMMIRASSFFRNMNL